MAQQRIRYLTVAVGVLCSLLSVLPSRSTADRISADEAWKGVGNVACVRYFVANPYESSKGNVFLNEKRDYKKGFSTVVFARSRNQFPPNPVMEYGHKTIEVTGRIQVYEGHPEIIAESSLQIRVVK